jgi:hypothetical protein
MSKQCIYLRTMNILQPPEQTMNISQPLEETMNTLDIARSPTPEPLPNGCNGSAPSPIVSSPMPPALMKP